VDARSDLFSYGVLIYELASGKRPFAGQSHADVSSAILRDSPPSLTSLRGDLPSELAHVVERCLEKRPRERFQTALDVLNELRSVRRTLERGAPAPQPTSDKIASIAVLLNPGRAGSHGHLSLTLLAEGRGAEALAVAMQEPEVIYRLWALADLHHALGHRTESDAALQELIENHAAEGAFQIANVYAERGEVDRAFEWLERAHAQRDTGLVEIKAGRHLRTLHGDARWGAFLTKMGFEE